MIANGNHTNRISNVEKQLSVRDFMVLNSMLLSRSALISRGLIDPPGRDIDRECGYPIGDMSPQGYWQLYNKEGYAARVVTVKPDECWSVYPELYETKDETTTEFEERWNDLVFDFDVWHYLHRVDRCSGIGRYGILLLGLNDGKDLLEPASGIDDFGMMTGTGKNELTYIRSFDESNVSVGSFETNTSSPRYGTPLFYNVNFLDPAGYSATAESTPTQLGIHRLVHWSRVIHVADNRESSEIFGMPRMRQVVNRLMDIRKVLGGSAEMFWKGAFPGYSFETQPQLGMENDINHKSIAEEFSEYYNGLKRYIALEGMTAKSLAPQISDPTNHLMQQLQAICATIGVPLRIFLGSEAGHLASTQDSTTWNRRLGHRQNTYITPKIIKPFVMRLCALGILPSIRKFHLDWTDLNAMSNKDRADVSLKRTQALMQYVTGGCETIMPPYQFLTQILEFTPEEANIIIELAKANKTDMLTESVFKKPETAGSGGRLGNAGADAGSPGTDGNGDSNS